MAIKIAGPSPVRPGASTDEAPEVPASIPRHRGNGSPKIRIGSSARFAYYKRASSYAKVIESEYNLNRWKLRAAVFGLSRLRHLVERAQAVETITEAADKDELHEIADAAMDHAGTTTRATRGTAFHKLTERQDKGEDLSYLGPEMLAALDAWRRLTAGWVFHGTEQFVVADEFEAAGSYDRLGSPPAPMVAPDGTRITPDDRIGLDLKSGQSSRYWGAGYAGQQAIYFGEGSCPYVHVSDEDAATGDDGRRPWLDGIAPRADWSLIPHVPIESPQDAALMWVDLRKGRAMLDLARSIYAARKLDGLFLPAELPAPLPPPPLPIFEAIGKAPDEPALLALYERFQDDWREIHTEAARARLAELGVQA